MKRFLTPFLVAMAAGCGDEMTGGDATSTASYEQPSPPADQRAQPESDVTAAPDPGPVANSRIVDKSFDDIKFDIEPDEPFEREMLSEEVEQLLGQRIRIRGYILPTFQRSGLTNFVLVRDNQECCFGPGAALYDCIVVEMQPGRAADFSVKPVAVEGKFTLNEYIGPDGKHLAIFHLDGEAVK